MKQRYQITPWKSVFVLLPLFAFFGRASAQIPVIADPAVSSLSVTNLADVAVNANLLNNNTVYKLKLGTLNLFPVGTIPSGSTSVIVALGSGMIVDPDFDLSTAPLSQYFTWSQSGTPVQITGVQHTALPTGFTGTLSFQVKTVLEGQYTTSGNFFASNHNNPGFILVDINGNNNSNSLLYNVVAQSTLPVNLLGFSANVKNCEVHAEWQVEKEVDFDRYELEASKDGAVFTKVATVHAQNLSVYKASFPLDAQWQGGNVLVRLKMIDGDGTFKYSKVVSVNGNCAARLAIYGYPNPVENIDYITIATKEGLFKGRYRLTLLDNSGKIVGLTNVELNDIQSFRYDLPPILAAGKYMIQVQTADGTVNSTISIQKL